MIQGSSKERILPLAARRFRRRFHIREETLLGYLLVLPAFAVIGLIVFFPAVLGFYTSFTNKIAGFDQVDFVGLKNYAELLRDVRLAKAVGRSMLFAAGSVSMKLLIALPIALFLNRVFVGRGLLRSVILVPWAMPLIVCVLIFTWLYNDLFGVLNYLLVESGLSGPISFRGDRRYAFFSGMAINIWRGIPFLSVNLLAGLQSISTELYEAADVDGATGLQSFWHITVPGLRTIALVACLMSFIWTANDFQTFWVLTRGGPGTSTEVFPIITFKTAFVALELGKGAAIPVLLMPFFLVLIVLLVRTVRRQEEER